MDDEQAVAERIRRIDALRRERAGPRALLAEVELLLGEAERWVGVVGERAGPRPSEPPSETSTEEAMMPR